MTPNTQQQEKKQIYWTSSTLKPYTIKKVERQHTEWEKVFVNHISDKKLIPRIYTELLQLNDKKKTQLKKGQGI